MKFSNISIFTNRYAVIKYDLYFEFIEKRHYVKVTTSPYGIYLIYDIKYKIGEKAMEQEKQMKLCKMCGILKERILVGKFDKHNKKYADETGKLWSGHYCPTCNVIRARENMRKLKEKNSA